MTKLKIGFVLAIGVMAITAGLVSDFGGGGTNVSWDGSASERTVGGNSM